MISRRFLIAEHEEAIYVTHTQRPRFVGIIYDADEAPVSGVTLSIGDAVVVDIDWIDPPVFDSEELLTAQGFCSRRATENAGKGGQRPLIHWLFRAFLRVPHPPPTSEIGPIVGPFCVFGCKE